MECSYIPLDKSIIICLENAYSTTNNYKFYFTIFIIYYDGVRNEERIFYIKIISVLDDS